MGSKDLDTAISRLYESLDSEKPEENSAKAINKLHAILAGRLFVLAKLLESCNKSLTPRIWLLLQLLPRHVQHMHSDFWIDLSYTFASSNGSELAGYICNTISQIKAIIQRQIPDHGRIPVAFDEAQIAINKYPDMFHATTSPIERRSLFAILLRTGLSIGGDDTSTILSGTGLRINDLKNDSGSAIMKQSITLDCFMGITDGFYDLNDMKEFIEQFLGHLTDEQITRIFQYIRGRRRYTVGFLEFAVRKDQDYVPNDIDLAVNAWRDQASYNIVNDLANAIPRIIQDQTVWPVVEYAILRSHVFSDPDFVLDSINAAFAVEVGFVQLHKINRSASGIVVIGGVSEPLAAIAYFKYAKKYKPIAKKILETMGRETWDQKHLGKLFERYLLDPLTNMFDNKTLGNHDLISEQIVTHPKLNALLMDNVVSINRHLDTLWNRDVPNLCASGSILSYLDDPKMPFLLPDERDGSGPDIVFTININDRESNFDIKIPVFVQAKFRQVVNIDDALKTVSPRTFFSDKRNRNSALERRQGVLDCLQRKYGQAKSLGLASIGILVMFPFEPRSRESYYDDKNQELIILIHGGNAHKFFEKKAIDMFNAIKDPIKRPFTFDLWKVWYNNFIKMIYLIIFIYTDTLLSYAIDAEKA